MIEQVPDRDRFSIVWKIRKDFGKRFVVAEFAALHQEHDGHGGELLCKGSQAEIRVRIDFRFCAEIAHTVAMFEDGFAILAYQRGEARRVRGGHAGKKRVDLLFPRTFRRLRLRLTWHT